MRQKVKRNKGPALRAKAGSTFKNKGLGMSTGIVPSLTSTSGMK